MTADRSGKPDSKEEFSRLLTAAKAGDEKAIARLAALFQDRVLTQVRARLSPGLRRRYDSMDVAQSVFADVLRGIDRFEDRGEGAFEAWLATIVRNKINSRFRKYLTPEGRRRERSAADRAEGVARGTTPSQAAERHEREETAARLIESLDPARRTLVRLRLDEGLSWGAIAERLGLPSEDAARKRFNRALAAMRQRAEGGSDAE